jgi:hypothetical protein
MDKDLTGFNAGRKAVLSFFLFINSGLEESDNREAISEA